MVYQMTTNGIHRIEENSIDKNSIEENRKENILPSPKVPDIYVIDLPTNRFNTTGECYYVLQDFYRLMEELYPNVDLMQQFNKMKAWLITNKTKRKTLNGMEKFINSWLSKQQDAPSYNQNTKNDDGWAYIDDEIGRIIEEKNNNVF